MPDQTTSNPTATISGVVGIVLYAATGFVYLTSGLVVPAPWLFLLWGVWLVGLYPLVRVFRHRRAWTPLVAVGAAAVWWLYVTLGGLFLDWTA
ncbi:MAG TPA: hypothetical protein VF148_11670 [Acidimicrobiia bacterium]